MQRIPYIGDPQSGGSGYRVGDVAFGLAPPDSTFIPANGAQYATASIAGLFKAGWTIVGMGGVIDTGLARDTGLCSYGGALYYGRDESVYSRTSATGPEVPMQPPFDNTDGFYNSYQYLGVANGCHFMSVNYLNGTKRWSYYVFGQNISSGWDGSFRLSTTAAFTLKCIAWCPAFGTYVFGLSNGLNYSSTPSSVTPSTGAPAASYSKLFVVGSTVYAQSPTIWAKSLDGGVTWTSAMPVNAPGSSTIGVAAGADYDAVSGKFYSVNSTGQVVSATDPLGTWSLEFDPGASMGLAAFSAVIATASGVVVFGNNGIATLGRDGVWGGELFVSPLITASYGQFNGPCSFGGYIFLPSTSANTRLFSDLDTRANAPLIAAGVKTAYVKVR